MSVFTSNTRKIALPLVLVGAGLVSGCDASSIFVNQNFGLANGAVVGSSVPGKAARANQASREAIAALEPGIIRQQAGKKLSIIDRQKALAAELEALEYSPVGHPVKWGKSYFGDSGIVTASKTYDVGTSNCRQYVHEMKVNGTTETVRATACKEQDGNWIPLT